MQKTDTQSVTLTRQELRFIAESLEVLASVDGGANWNDSECLRLANYLRNEETAAKREP